MPSNETSHRLQPNDVERVPLANGSLNLFEARAFP